MVTSTSQADDDYAPQRRHPVRFVNALVGALVTFFLALLGLAYNAGIASASINTIRDNQAAITKEVETLRDNQSSSQAAITARLSAIQQMQQDMANTQAQMQAQLQTKTQGNR